MYVYISVCVCVCVLIQLASSDESQYHKYNSVTCYTH